MRVLQYLSLISGYQHKYIADMNTIFILQSGHKYHTSQSLESKKSTVSYKKEWRGVEDISYF
jgi:uncharacterized protein YaaW (UPF0174 family)